MTTVRDEIHYSSLAPFLSLGVGRGGPHEVVSHTVLGPLAVDSLLDILALVLHILAHGRESPWAVRGLLLLLPKLSQLVASLHRLDVGLVVRVLHLLVLQVVGPQDVLGAVEVHWNMPHHPSRANQPLVLLSMRAMSKGVSS